MQHASVFNVSALSINASLSINALSAYALKASGLIRASLGLTQPAMARSDQHLSPPPSQFIFKS